MDATEEFDLNAYEAERLAAAARCEEKVNEIIQRREQARWVARRARRGRDHAERAAHDAEEALAAPW